MLVVQKYGGTSVGSIERMKAVAARCLATQRQGHQVAEAVGIDEVRLRQVQDDLRAPLRDERVEQLPEEVLGRVVDRSRRSRQDQPFFVRDLKFHAANPQSLAPSP